MVVTARFIFVDKFGQDIADPIILGGLSTDEYFDEPPDTLIAGATSIPDADAILCHFYGGPAADGIGLRWELEERLN